MKIDLRKYAGLFAGISTDELSGLLSCLEVKTKQYEKKDIILLMEDKVDNIGLVIEGAVLIIKENVTGNQSIIDRIGQYELFGEAFVCAGIEKSPVTVIAAERCEIMWMHFRRIISTCPKACEAHSKLVENMMKLLALKILHINQKIEITSKKSIRDKLMTYLLLQADKAKSFDFTIPLNRSELADYLYADRSALSRELCKMRDEGLIEFKKNHFHMIIDKLEQK